MTRHAGPHDGEIIGSNVCGFFDDEKSLARGRTLCGDERATGVAITPVSAFVRQSWRRCFHSELNVCACRAVCEAHRWWLVAGKRFATWPEQLASGVQTA